MKVLVIGAGHVGGAAVDALKARGHGPITTEIVTAAGPFFFAEDYHQQYLAKNPGGYCGLGGTGVSCPVGLAAAALGAFMYFGIHERAGDQLKFMPWIGMDEYTVAVFWIAILGPILTLLPTLVLTRKYLKV